MALYSQMPSKEEADMDSSLRWNDDCEGVNAVF